MENEEVETFRDREYPQLAGKIYLDHGGSTVSLHHMHMTLLGQNI